MRVRLLSVTAAPLDDKCESTYIAEVNARSSLTRASSTSSPVRRAVPSPSRHRSPGKRPLLHPWV
jgi:hypothetical protein